MRTWIFGDTDLSDPTLCVPGGVLGNGLQHHRTHSEVKNLPQVRAAYSMAEAPCRAINDSIDGPLLRMRIRIYCAAWITLLLAGEYAQQSAQSQISGSPDRKVWRDRDISGPFSSCPGPQRKHTKRGIIKCSFLCVNFALLGESKSNPCQVRRIPAAHESKRAF